MGFYADMKFSPTDNKEEMKKKIFDVKKVLTQRQNAANAEKRSLAERQFNYLSDFEKIINAMEDNFIYWGIVIDAACFFIDTDALYDKSHGPTPKELLLEFVKQGPNTLDVGVAVFNHIFTRSGDFGRWAVMLAENGATQMFELAADWCNNNNNGNKAVDFYKKALECGRYSARTPFILGCICSEDNNNEEALKYFNMAAQMEDDEFHYKYKSYYELGRGYENGVFPGGINLELAEKNYLLAQGKLGVPNLEDSCMASLNRIRSARSQQAVSSAPRPVSQPASAPVRQPQPTPAQAPVQSVKKKKFTGLKVLAVLVILFFYVVRPMAEKLRDKAEEDPISSSTSEASNSSPKKDLAIKDSNSGGSPLSKCSRFGTNENVEHVSQVTDRFDISYSSGNIMSITDSTQLGMFEVPKGSKYMCGTLLSTNSSTYSFKVYAAYDEPSSMDDIRVIYQYDTESQDCGPRPIVIDVTDVEYIGFTALSNGWLSSNDVGRKHAALYNMCFYSDEYDYDPIVIDFPDPMTADDTVFSYAVEGFSLSGQDDEIDIWGNKYTSSSRFHLKKFGYNDGNKLAFITGNRFKYFHAVFAPVNATDDRSSDTMTISGRNIKGEWETLFTHEASKSTKPFAANLEISGYDSLLITYSNKSGNYLVDDFTLSNNESVMSEIDNSGGATGDVCVFDLIAYESSRFSEPSNTYTDGTGKQIAGKNIRVLFLEYNYESYVVYNCEGYKAITGQVAYASDDGYDYDGKMVIYTQAADSSDWTEAKTVSLSKKDGISDFSADIDGAARVKIQVFVSNKSYWDIERFVLKDVMLTS